MILKRFMVKDIVFLAVMAALLFLCSAVSMPVMSIDLFGLRNMITAIFYSLFATVTLMKVPKVGALTLLGFFNAVILFMMSPVMFVTNFCSALLAEIVVLLVFRGYEGMKAIVTAACLVPILALPFTALFSMIINGKAFSEVIQASPTVALTCTGTVVLSLLGGFLGRKIGGELKKAGKI